MTAPVRPVFKSIRVACSPEHAFATFTDGLGTWWPLHTHSISVLDDGSEVPVTAVLEGHEGGRMYEVACDGRECEWGRVLAWEPPHRLVIEWQVDPANAPTEIEVTFTADGDATRVDLEHRYWERLGEEAVRMQASYDEGWGSIMPLYGAAAGLA